MTAGGGPHTGRADRATRRKVAAAVSVAILAASLSACTSHEASPDAVGPADAYVALVLGLGDEQALRQFMGAQEAIAACMAEAGFEYLPTSSGLVFGDQLVIDPPRDSREFAEQYGYGYRSQPPGMTSSSLGDNPNDALVAAMSQAEVAEYYLALFGTTSEDYEAVGSPEDFEMDWRRSGCIGRAQHEVYDTGPQIDPTYLALDAEIDRIDAEVVPTHPDVVAADVAWVECMADAGFPGYTRQPEAAERELDRYYTSGDGEGVVGPDGKTQGEVEGLPQETAIATADWDCTDPVGYDDVVARVRNAAQQEYVDAHRDELDAWVEAFAAPEQPGN